MNDFCLLDFDMNCGLLVCTLAHVCYGGGEEHC